ncbi:MAG: asparagine synthase (glutamine-hydrolyzing) [Planctomycetes bacterium]|nr:asparagine synthase (glutamine-hydrolyzing) [Planctomycetota bacterium]
MCGLAGLLNSSQHPDQWSNTLTSMGARISHRGPDYQGHWYSAEDEIGMVHCRLSILDTSEHGNQPMKSRSGRFVISYNGELYNFHELRSELKSHGHPVESDSDTEVLLEGIECWGLEKCLSKCAGMFAFALWDTKKKELTLARDRIGIKPLYYGIHGNMLSFCSELHALMEVPGIELKLDRNSLGSYLRHNYISSPHSIYQSVRKLPPGTWIRFRSGSPLVEAKPIRYWSASEQALAGITSPFEGNYEEAKEALEEKFTHVISQHMLSDVPLGAFLSGGIDSSLVCSFMAKLSSKPIKTFSIGFHEKRFDEARYAKETASHIGSDHTELYLSPSDVLEHIPTVLALCDEPFADSSQIPTWMVSRLTRSKVTVSLSGDGGDELFGGYTRYLYAQSVWKALSRIPSPLKKMGSSFLSSVPQSIWDNSSGILNKLLPKGGGISHLGDKAQLLSRLCSCSSPKDLYLSIASLYHQPQSLLLEGEEYPSAILDKEPWSLPSSFTEQMMLIDLLTYLPGDILTKVDRASMGLSLEARVPLLDHRLVDFAWSLPLEFKCTQGQGKRILRDILAKHIPRRLIDRPKMGFSIPLAQWLRGPLREWCEELFSEKSLQDSGVWNSAEVRKLWAEHLSAKKNHQYILWNIVVFQQWLKANPKVSVV